MNYSEAIQFLYGLQLFGANLGLETPRQLARLAGDPQDRLRFIHVAGTNGKGSTCAMLESIYRAAGLRVGLFTSPHLVSFRERIQVNRQPIPEADLIRLVTEIQRLFETLPPGTHPTLFEAVTVMALSYFAEQQCDLVIWETGLGGRLDVTNMVTPLASVITNIALDHTQWLGDTLEKIAAEKAGIIKPGIPVITGVEAPKAFQVIEQVAREKNAPLTLPQLPTSNFHLPKVALLGEHQQRNARVAAAVVELLQGCLPVSDDQLRSGLATVSWAGRLQLLTRTDGRKILLDGAHNVDGAKTLRQSLETEFAGERPTFIFGALEDKSWAEICRLLAPLATRVIAVPVASSRTAAPEALARAFQEANLACTVATASHLLEALAACQADPFVVITGSLYLVGEALEQLEPSPAGSGERGLNEWRVGRATPCAPS